MRHAIALLLAPVLALGACAGADAKRYTVTPETQVLLRGGNRKPAQANYRVTPEDAARAAGGAGN